MTKLEIKGGTSRNGNGWKHLYANGKLVDQYRDHVSDEAIYACYEKRMKREKPTEIKKSVIKSVNGLHKFLTSHPDF